ncbi:hypothetical protein OQA88_1077 [Cercophora sp. LCS_1]
MVGSSKVSKASRAKPAAKPTTKPFPLNKLAAELREKVWEEALLNEAKPSATSASKRTPDPLDFGHLSLTQFFTFQPPSSANACDESLAVAARLQRKNSTAFKREIQIPGFFEIDAKKTTSMVPLLANNQLIGLGVDSILKKVPGLLSLRGKKSQGRRIFELLAASNDGQIKVNTSQSQDFIIPARTPTAAGKGWIGALRLVSLDDTMAWEELREVAKATGLPWGFVDDVLNADSAARSSYIREALGSLQDLWTRENARRKKAGLEQLDMPKIDVCAWVQVTHSLMGGPMEMLGFEGVPNREALESLVSWGVL